MLTATAMNAGRKIPTVPATAPGRSGDQVADEGRGREQRPRGGLADRDRIDELCLGDPAEALDQLARSNATRT